MTRIGPAPEPPAVCPVPHENFDAAVAPTTEAAVACRLDQECLTLDMAAVRFADSSGLGVLVRLHARYPGRVRLMNVGPGLCRCLGRAPADRLPPLATPEPVAADDAVASPASPDSPVGRRAAS